MQHAEYTRVLRPLLPREIFRPQRSHLARIFLHLTLLAAGWSFIAFCPPALGWLGALLAGHSVGCLGFLAHDVSHRTVVSSRWAIRGWELLLFGVNMIPPTVWRRIHNQAHHAETNTPRDPDRRFCAGEESPGRRVYACLFYPGHGRIWQGSLAFAHFVAYIVKWIVSALLPEQARLPCTVRPRFSRRQRLAVLAELLWLGLLQAALWVLMGSSWTRFVWASPATLLFASAVVMTYVFTNHFLNPLSDHTDPVAVTTSVIVPPAVDWLHDNFSYHTEHHLFPNLNPQFYPLVSRLLIEHFPDRYQRLRLQEAWHKLRRQDVLGAAATGQIERGGSASSETLRQRSSRSAGQVI